VNLLAPEKKNTIKKKEAVVAKSGRYDEF